MAIDPDYKDFRCYELLDDGEKEELDVEINAVSTLFSSEQVLLLVRYDLRRIFIWKGPRSPVRKRFISSRVGSKIQEESSKIGMHLKIVSVDAGDEVIEFLQAFRVDPYEITAEDRPDEMRYVRNVDRVKQEEAELKAKLQRNKPKKEEYWSPALGTQSSPASVTKQAANAVSSVSKPVARPVSKSTPKPAYKPRRTAPIIDNKALLEKILKEEAPAGMKRLNIIIGTSLYGAQKVISKVFGKEVENEKWELIGEIPDGKIDLEAGMLRAYCENNQVQGIEVFQKSSGSPKSEPKKRSLKPIPTG